MVAGRKYWLSLRMCAKLTTSKGVGIASQGRWQFDTQERLISNYSRRSRRFVALERNSVHYYSVADGPGSHLIVPPMRLHG